MIMPSSYGALSAISANTIKGNAPTFTGQSKANKLGFVVNGTAYSQALGNINSNEIKYFDAGVKLSDFTITNLTAADFSLMTDYVDADGDVGHPIAPFSMEIVTYDWYEGNIKLDKNNTAVMNQVFGCGSSLSLPLTLKITLPKVKVRSGYGSPNESSPIDLVKTYKIGTATGICFAKPNQMIVNASHSWLNSSIEDWEAGGAIPDHNNGGGYTTDFDPINGFKSSATTKFPTTGFPKASFTLIMTSNAKDYKFTHNGGSALTVDTNGKVTLHSKPTGAVTITATFKNDTNQVHRYTFNPTSVWVVPKLNSMNYTSAVTACGGANKIPSRAQLTNSPRKIAPQGWSYITNYYTRSVDGSIFGEWGLTDSDTYPGSNWSLYWYWTRDSYSYSDQFYVHSSNGGVGWDSINSSLYIACLE
ncbi:hypothetical protein RCS94_10385 [Orbaceae bacterium ac157xtp]